MDLLQGHELHPVAAGHEAKREEALTGAKRVERLGRLLYHSVEAPCSALPAPFDREPSPDELDSRDGGVLQQALELVPGPEADGALTGEAEEPHIFVEAFDDDDIRPTHARFTMGERPRLALRSNPFSARQNC
ncbi:MAG: hypothetical protein R3B72_17945 [Polyangiaceae bacterium]